MRLTIMHIATAREILTLIAGAFMMLPASAAAPEPSRFDAGSDNKLGLTFSPDGRTAFWVEWDGKWGDNSKSHSLIYVARENNGEWSVPEPVPFSGQHSDGDPYVSPDGQWLYFVSDRPVDESDRALDRNIWRYRLVAEHRLEYLSINSNETEYSPVVTTSGRLYFASDRDGGPGQGDIYRAEPLGNEFAPADLLGPAANRPTGEWNLWVSADETEMILEASSRPSNISASGDLYVSFNTAAGWTAALPAEELNSGGSDLMPRVHPDGNTLYYTTAMMGEHARIKTANWRRIRTELRSAYAPILLVANRSSHEIAFVDLLRGEIAARAATGEGPHLLSNVSNGRVLATGYGVFPKPHAERVSRRPPFVEELNSRLTVIDVASQSVLLDRVLEGCARPHASWIVGTRAYVTCETEKRVLALDLASGRQIGHFDTQQEGSHVIGYDPGSGQLAVSNTDSGSLTLIDVETGSTRVVELGAGSEGMLVAGDRVWVANALDGSISVVDAETATAETQIESVCSFPISLSQDAKERVWVACFGSAELVVIDNGTYAVEQRIGLDDQPLGLLLHPQRELAYVSLPRQNAVAEIDLISGAELRRIAVGIEPDGLRWATQ